MNTVIQTSNWSSRFQKCIHVVSTTGFWLIAASSSASAFHLSGVSVLDRLWDPNKDALLNPGYLEYQLNPAFNPARYGEEWTGWVDIRHPALDGTTQLIDPFDRSNRFVNVHSKVVTDGSVPAQTAMPNIQRDFDFSNKVYAQAGISVINTATVPVTEGGVTFPLSNAERTTVVSNNRAGGANVNNYYVGGFNSGVNGITRFPSANPGAHGMLIADQARNSTFAHELGHMLLNVGNPGHVNDPQNFFYETGSNYAFNDVGITAGLITDDQIDRIFSNPGPHNPGFVQGITENPLFHRYGNQVDWDFVTDHTNLEDRANGADSHSGLDSLFWGIGNAVPSDHTGHDHTGLGNFMHPGNFTKQAFQFVDVFSLNLRYSDFDLGAADDKAGALDYSLFFRKADGTFEEGKPVVSFSKGWSDSTNADDFLTRWVSPFDATGLFIFADNSNQHDGIAQIDAVIAGTAKEKDFGDAPNSYKTLLVSDGPRYDEGSSQFLGSRWDSEPDGQPTPFANGDDINLWGVGGPDDEDGVVFGDSWVDVTFNFNRPGLNDYQLRAWWDINESGMFDHPSELFIDDLLMDRPPSQFTKRYETRDKNGQFFNPKKFFSRFRLTWDPKDPDVKPFGEFFSKPDCTDAAEAAGTCISHGEVEDYPAPEPLTIIASGLAVGFGVLCQREYTKKRRKK